MLYYKMAFIMSVCGPGGVRGGMCLRRRNPAGVTVFHSCQDTTGTTRKTQLRVDGSVPRRSRQGQLAGFLLITAARRSYVEETIYKMGNGRERVGLNIKSVSPRLRGTGTLY